MERKILCVQLEEGGQTVRRGSGQVALTQVELIVRRLLLSFVVDRYIYEALDFIRHHPEYVYLFQVFDDVQALKAEKL